MGMYIKIYAFYTPVKRNQVHFIATLPAKASDTDKGLGGSRKCSEHTSIYAKNSNTSAGNRIPNIHSQVTPLGELLLPLLVYTMSDPEENNLTA
jgi:hypothetical protein